MIDDKDLTADAFENDNKDHLNKEYGKAVTERNVTLESGSFGPVADPQFRSLSKYCCHLYLYCLYFRVM